MPNGTGLKGKIAICSRGYLGLITEDGQKVVTYKRCPGCVAAYGWNDSCTCETGLAYVGVHLTGDKAGQPWSSRNPRVVGEIRGSQPVQIIDSVTSNLLEFYI
jgi:hypothetical protein